MGIAVLIALRDTDRGQVSPVPKSVRYWQEFEQINLLKNHFSCLCATLGVFVLQTHFSQTE